MRSSVGFFPILIVIVHLGFESCQHVSIKIGDISSSLPGTGRKKGGCGMEDDKMSLPCLF